MYLIGRNHSVVFDMTDVTSHFRKIKTILDEESFFDVLFRLNSLFQLNLVEILYLVAILYSIHRVHVLCFIDEINRTNHSRKIGTTPPVFSVALTTLYSMYEFHYTIEMRVVFELFYRR